MNTDLFLYQKYKLHKTPSSVIFPTVSSVSRMVPRTTVGPQKMGCQMILSPAMFVFIPYGISIILPNLRFYNWCFFSHVCCLSVYLFFSAVSPPHTFPLSSSLLQIILRTKLEPVFIDFDVSALSDSSMWRTLNLPLTHGSLKKKVLIFFLNPLCKFMLTK